MFRKEMPRVYELRDLIDDPSASCAYFQDFDDSIRDDPSKKNFWLAREREFQRLDPDSWQLLKSEAAPHLTTRCLNGRGWQQLISILNQARAHNYLIDNGCMRVRFIPRSKTQGQKTPDLEGELNGKKVLCEVKTINISEDEVTRRQTGEVMTITNLLETGFFNKLMSDLYMAKTQMELYDGSICARHIAFVLFNFDDFLAEYKSHYFEQIDRHLGDNPISGIEIVFYNQGTAFHCPVVMRHAVVVTEAQ